MKLRVGGPYPLAGSKRIEVIDEELTCTKATQLIVSEVLLSRTQHVLWQNGRRGLEGVAYWAGVLTGGIASVTCVIAPRAQAGRGATGLFVAVSSQEVARIHRDMEASGLALLAKVHSHPGRAYHSHTDDRMAISNHEGFLSIVVPNFARGPLNSMRHCAVYEAEPDGKWRQLSQVEVADRVIIR